MKAQLLLLVLLAGATAPAQSFFSTLGPGDSYIENVGRAVSGSANPITSSYGEWGWQFTSQATGAVAQLKVGAHWLTGANAVTVRIHANGPAESMGAVLGLYSVTGLPAFNTPEHITVIDIASPSVNLAAGTKYWVSMAPQSADTYAAWMDNDQSMFGRMSVSADGVNYNYVNTMPYSAFSLSAVPEPSTSAAILCGVLLIKRRRRNRG